MKINKKYYAVIEWIIAIVLLVITYKFSLLSYGSFSPIKAHEKSERTFHYGPSKIIKTIDLDGEMIYLSRYKDWFSASSVRKEKIKWYPGNVGGIPIDYSKQVSYSWSGSSNKEGSMRMVVFGYVSDPNITTMLLTVESGINTLRYDLDESRMFIFYWNESEDKQKNRHLRGLNIDGKAVYEGITF